MTARVVAATSRGLLREVREGRFRADLYFRLNVVQLRLPPLRERRGDVASLVRALLPRLAASVGVAPCELDDAVLSRLAARSWPGNVRELMNVLERLLIRGAGRRVELADLEGIFDSEPWPLPDPGGAPLLGFADRDAGSRPAPAPERIAAVLRSNAGNVARAARELGHAAHHAPPSAAPARSRRRTFRRLVVNFARLRLAARGLAPACVARFREGDGAARGRRRLVRGAALLADLPRGGATPGPRAAAATRPPIGAGRSRSIPGRTSAASPSGW